jgi:hypothetical protein
MQTLLKPNSYPPEIRRQLGLMTPLATEIANRWILGWPKAVKSLIEEGGYLEALKDQEQRELRAYSQPGNSHLARHEIAEVYGLSPAPPSLA